MALLLLTFVLTIIGLSASIPQRYNGTLGHVAPPPNGFGQRPIPAPQQQRGVIHKVFTPNNSPFESSISSGLCYTEVPTASLATSTGYMPQSNGTRPGYSKIQTCCEGYKPKPNRFRVCEAICDTGCVNSNCTAPNVCTCYPGYILDTVNDNCIPKCPIGCANGYCRTPTSTECICKPGYKLDPRGEQCIPECVHGCGNGRCVSPGVCDCARGYKRNEAGGCTHYCEGGCGLNEDCMGPNQCLCRIGYTKNAQNQCVAHCDRPCLPGHICTSPNKCTCIDKNGANCQASCSQPCLNGMCIGKNVCQCNPGYVIDSLSWYKCIAHCPQGCLNGVCSAPGMCICNPGFRKASNINGHVCIHINQ